MNSNETIEERRIRLRDDIDVYLSKIQEMSQDVESSDALEMMHNCIDAIMSVIEYSSIHILPFMTTILLMAVRNGTTTSLEKIVDDDLLSTMQMGELEVMAGELVNNASIELSVVYKDGDKGDESTYHTPKEEMAI